MIRYADWCLGQLPPPLADDNELDEEDLGETMADAALRVDDRPIPRDLFRAGMADDRPGATSLYWLGQWVRPTVAALTRDRVLLQRAIADRELAAAARAVADAGAHATTMDTVEEVGDSMQCRTGCRYSSRGRYVGR